MEKKVAIIGAGVSGLLACKYALSKGYHPTVFEAKGNIGGVWTKTLETTKLQTPRPYYQFSDFPWPDSVTEEYPSQRKVFPYLESYARHFDLYQYIRFHRKVIGINFEGPSDKEMVAWTQWGGSSDPFGSKGKWKVIVPDTQNSTNEVHEFDFVIVCIGKFSDAPNFPHFPPGEGPEVFNGKVMHCIEYSDLDFNAAHELVRGKQVTIVGFQKYALDVALECARVNGPKNPCTILYRRAHWNLPDALPFGIPLGYLFFNRVLGLAVHKPGEGFWEWLLAVLLSPLRWGVVKCMEIYIKRLHWLDKWGIVPEHSILDDLGSCVTSIVPDGFFEAVAEGSIILKKAPWIRFCRDGIYTDDQSKPLKTNLVIMATGFRGLDKLKDIFVSPAFQDLLVGESDKILPLYRDCIQPRIPQMAIIGFTESFANLYTAEMRCRWLAELLDGKFKLPSIAEMEKDIAKWDKFQKDAAGKYFHRSCSGTIHVWANDQICKDMGWNPKRKKGFFANLFDPYLPTEYTQPNPTFGSKDGKGGKLN
ncbi:Flavin-containing monooxygenase [Bertholletia excelsa]